MLRVESIQNDAGPPSRPLQLALAPALRQDEIDRLDLRGHRQRFDSDDRQAGGEVSASGGKQAAAHGTELDSHGPGLFAWYGKAGCPDWHCTPCRLAIAPERPLRGECELATTN